jgi:hypothetical protein
MTNTTRPTIRKEIAEMIPPAYSHLVGSQLMAHLAAQAA